MTIDINIDELESWSIRAAEALQEFCDEAQMAAGNPDGEDQLQDVRALLEEHCRIITGRPSWQGNFCNDANKDTISQFNVGDKVQFTDQTIRLNARGGSATYKTVRGTIESINDKQVATINVSRGKTRSCHVNNLTHQGRTSELGIALINALSEINNIAKECDQETQS